MKTSVGVMVDTSSTCTALLSWERGPSQSIDQPYLELKAGKVVVARIYHIGGPENGLWLGVTLTRTTRRYRHLLKCIQAVEKHFSIAIN